MSATYRDGRPTVMDSLVVAIASNLLAMAYIMMDSLSQDGLWPVSGSDGSVWLPACTMSVHQLRLLRSKISKSVGCVSGMSGRLFSQIWTPRARTMDHAQNHICASAASLEPPPLDFRLGFRQVCPDLSFWSMPRIRRRTAESQASRQATC